MNQFLKVFTACFLLVSGCQQSTSYRTDAPPAEKITKPLTPNSAVVHGPMANAAAIMERKQVPILCYHQIRDWKPTDSKRAKDYIVPPAEFRAQMKLLADSGYHAILPDQLMNYLKYGDPLPEKPFMLSFDDTDLDQFTHAKPVMDEYNFKAVFFIMTVSLNKPRYMSKDQVKQLSDEGHTIGSHTWDHMNVKKFEEKDWAIQVEKPLKQLEGITGKPVRYFAYPFGLWKPEVIPGIRDRKIEAAFQLSENRDVNDPLFTIRRIIVPGQWSPQTMHSVMKRSFP